MPFRFEIYDECFFRGHSKIMLRNIFDPLSLERIKFVGICELKTVYHHKTTPNPLKKCVLLPPLPQIDKSHYKIV